MPAFRYWELTLAAPAAVVEGLTNFLWERGALGVVEEELPGGQPRLRAFFAGDTDAAALLDPVRDYGAALAALGLPGPGPPTLLPLTDPGWARAWQEHFRPLAVGRRLLVMPPWERGEAAAGDRLTLVIEPGRAFGTGHHATTRGCLEQLEAIVAAGPPGRVTDLGTGSGILAIAALRLGAARALAVDDDPDAVAAAAANAARNGVGDRLETLCADAAAVEATPAPLVLANLLTAAHRRLAPIYPRLLEPGGRLVAGGILDEEASGVAAALAARGLRTVGRHSLDGWTTMVVGRDATVHDRA